MHGHATINKSFLLLLVFSFACSTHGLADTLSNAPALDVRTNLVAEGLTELSERARTYFNQGEFAKAQRLLEVCLEKTEQKLGREHVSVASLLAALGDCSLLLGDLEQAAALFQRALAITERVQGTDNPDAVRILGSLASIYKLQGNEEQALALYERSLAILEKAFGSKHPTLLGCLVDLAAVHRELGNLAKALVLLRRAQTISEKYSSLDDDVAVVVEGALASAYQERGDDLLAAELLQRNLSAREKSLKPENPAFFHSLDNLASLYAAWGAWDRAFPLLEQRVSIKEGALGAGSQDLAGSLEALANCCSQLGNYQQAAVLYQRAISIREAAFGKEGLGVVPSLCHFAECCQRQAKYEEASALLQHGLAITERYVGPDHIGAADIVRRLADVQLELGNYDQALTLSKRASSTMEKLVGKEHRHLVRFLTTLAAVYRAQADYRHALPPLEHALRINKRVFGKSSDSAVASLRLLSLVCIEQGDWQHGAEYFSVALRALGASFVTTFLAVSDEGQLLEISDASALKLVSRIWFHSEMFHSICALGDRQKCPNIRLWGAEQLASSKALFEEVKAAQWRLEWDSHTWTKELWEHAQAVKAELSLLPERNKDPAERERRRAQLQAELAELKTKMGARLALLAQNVSAENLKLADIAGALPAQSALVDFVQYHRYDFSSRTNEPKELRYAAYLTFPLAIDSTNIHVERVDLGQAAPSNEAVEFICKRMSSGMGYARDDVTAALQHLGGLVYAPLAKYLTNVSHLIVCPDGQLSRVPFEMLRVGDRFLIEDKTISYVTSGREIVRLEGSLKSKVQSLKSLVMGGPDFDLDLSKAGSASFQLAGSAGIPARSSADAKQDALPLAGRMPALRSLSRDYREIKFPPLPGAEAEARSVAKLLGGDCVLRVGPDAREAELKAVVSPRVLHLATHGFFLSDQEFRRTNSLPFGWPGEWGQAGRRPYVQNDWENPLVRCGIALAGANRAGQITNAVAEDGVLTGLEASLLNLQGTELVILSACNTGAGDVKIGEGVMSLRRAFRIAGAQTVLASHWPVNDEATSKLMKEFIGRWHAGEPRAKAWREAQLSLLHSKEYSNPYFWAAFTLTGQWR
jgi:CHAT domain-containing protein/tetratricopeptide (TPR) repeat protein